MSNLHHKSAESSTADKPENPVEEAYKELFGRYDWDCFATLTFNKPQRDAIRAIRMMEAWLKNWHFDHACNVGDATPDVKSRKDAYGRLISKSTFYKGPFENRWKRGKGRPHWVAAIEQHKSGGNHIHALIELQDYKGILSRKDAWHLWAKRMGKGGIGWARIDQPRSQEQVKGYIGKYIAKERGDLFYSENFTAARIDARDGI